jgi:hypothetical protein
MAKQTSLTQEVSCCGDCPMHSEEAHSSGFYFCTHPMAPDDDAFRKDVNVDVGIEGSEHLPIRCPLREQPLLLRHAKKQTKRNGKKKR